MRRFLVLILGLFIIVKNEDKNILNESINKYT